MGDGTMFARADCINELDKSNGDLEKALLELEKKALEPMKKRLLRPRECEDHSTITPDFTQSYEDVVTNKDVSFEVNVLLN